MTRTFLRGDRVVVNRKTDFVFYRDSDGTFKFPLKYPYEKISNEPIHGEVMQVWPDKDVTIKSDTGRWGTVPGKSVVLERDYELYEKKKEERDTMNQPEYISVSNIRIGDTIRVMGPKFKVAEIDEDGDPCDENGDYVGGLYLKKRGHDVLLISRDEPKLPTETGSIIRNVRLTSSALLAPLAVLNAEGLWYLPHLVWCRDAVEPDEIVSWSLDGDDDDSDNDD